MRRNKVRIWVGNMEFVHVAPDGKEFKLAPVAPGLPNMQLMEVGVPEVVGAEGVSRAIIPASGYIEFEYGL